MRRIQIEEFNMDASAKLYVNWQTKGLEIFGLKAHHLWLLNIYNVKGNVQNSILTSSQTLSHFLGQVKGR